MSKETIPLSVADITPFARSLSEQLQDGDGMPSHLSLLNMLARAAGFSNFQHLRASQVAKGRMSAAEAPADYNRVEKCLHHFDAMGRLIRWPSKRNVQEVCLWVMWAQLPSGTVLHEREVNGILNAAHLFDDAAILRRSMVGLKLVSRNLDGSDYQRIEQQPSPEAIAVIREISKRGDIA